MCRLCASYHCHMVNDEQVCGSNDEILIVDQIYVSSSWLWGCNEEISKPLFGYLIVLCHINDDPITKFWKWGMLSLQWYHYYYPSLKMLGYPLLSTQWLYLSHKSMVKVRNVVDIMCPPHHYTFLGTQALSWQCQFWFWFWFGMICLFLFFYLES